MIPAPMMLTVRLDAAPMMVDLRSGISTSFVALGWIWMLVLVVIALVLPFFPFPLLALERRSKS